MRLIFATNNIHKMNEIKAILGHRFEKYVFSMSDLGIRIDPEESGQSFTDNATIKSNALYYELKSKNILEPGDLIISDDTGLCIDFFDGAPGIKSKRFMGADTNQDEKNMRILELMKDVEDDKRTAYFITVLSVIDVGDYVDKLPKHLIFEGRVDGYIAKTIEKTDGFGYDPVFAVGSPSDISKSKVKTYSNLGFDEKNRISHRANALKKLVQYLENNHNI